MWAHRTPPDVVLGLGLGNDTLVFGRATRLRARADGERTRVGEEGALFPLERSLISTDGAAL